jgi:predicted transcriptional regulator
MVKIDPNGETKTKWIPKDFQRSAQTIAEDAVKQFVKNNQVIGLGSVQMAATIVVAPDIKEILKCIASSTHLEL